MRKILLLMAALLTAAATFAQSGEGMTNWEKTFAPVAEKGDIDNVKMAQGGEGSIYVATNCNTAFTFGGQSVAAPEVASSAVIVKYGKDGSEAWAITLDGAATVTAMTADADGTLYAAGTILGSVTVGETTLEGDPNEDDNYGFLLKISADGTLQAQQTFAPAPDDEVTMNFDAGYFYYQIDPLTVTPTSVKLDGDRVYISAKAYGDVPALGWKGAYANVWGMATDVASYGVFSLSKSDLSGAQSEACLRQTGEGTDLPAAMSEPEAFNFAVQGGVVSVAFFCYGNVTLTTPGGSKSFSYATDAETGAKTHALVLATTVGGFLMAKEFPSAEQHAREGLGIYGISDIALDGTVAYLGGTCYGSFPLDSEVNQPNTYAFVAAFDMTSASVKWSQAMPTESRGVAMILTGEEIHAATTAGVADISAADGTLKGVNDELNVDAAASWADQYAAIAVGGETSVYVASVKLNSDQPDGPAGGMLPGFWEKSFEPVAEGQESDLKGLHTATGLDGSVYASATYNKTLQIGGRTLPDTEGMVSSLVVKYDKQGREEWAISLVGAATVGSMAVDTDGTLYVAGTFEDEVALTDAAGQSQTLAAGYNVQPLFLLKVSPEGAVQAVRTITPEVDADIAAAVDPFEGYPLYGGWEPIYVSPTTVKLSGSKLYVAASYKGDVPELGWEGAYLDFWGAGYDDNRSKGIFSLDKASLGSARSELTVQNAELVSYNQFYPEALNFDFDAEGNLVFAFVGFGNLTATTPAGGKDFRFYVADDESGMKVHNLVFGTLKADGTASCINWDAEAHDKDARPYSISTMTQQDGKFYLGGTCYGNFWFDGVTRDFNYAFAAAYDPAIEIPIWSVAAPAESQGLSLLSGSMGTISGTVASTTVGTTLIRPDGTVYSGMSLETAFSELAQYKSISGSYICAKGSRVFVGGYYDEAAAEEERKSIATAISGLDITPAQAPAARYNMSGQRVGAGYRGIVIQGGKKFLAK